MEENCKTFKKITRFGTDITTSMPGESKATNNLNKSISSYKLHLQHHEKVVTNCNSSRLNTGCLETFTANNGTERNFKFFSKHIYIIRTLITICVCRANWYKLNQSIIVTVQK
jgi:hypothetical protein